MKIYLAAQYSRLLELREYRGDLEALGHVVTSRWIDHDPRATYAGLLDWECEMIARKDWKDVRDAQCVVLFTEDASRSRGGKHVEFGIGLALRKTLLVVGPRENVFHHLPEVRHFSCWEDALNYLKT